MPVVGWVLQGKSSFRILCLTRRSIRRVHAEMLVFVQHRLTFFVVALFRKGGESDNWGRKSNLSNEAGTL